MFFPDLLKLLHRLGVRQVNDVTAQVTAEITVTGAVGGIAHAVQPSASQGLSPGCFVVPCTNASMYGRQMRDILIVDFYIDSDFLIGFRSSDGKVVFSDLLVGVGRYTNVEEAQNAMSLMFQHEDQILADLESLEVDEMLLENKVCLHFKLIIYS